MIGCEEKPPDTTISQFDRPQDVALVCHDPQQLTDKTPLTCCGIKTYPVDPSDPCADSKSSTAILYAFVTQTTPGEVAVVDVNRNQIIDQDGRIPYNSFIPVGGQPSDIVASSDGKRVFTVNYETGDLSIINTTDALKKNPVVTPASTIELGAPAGRITLNTTPLQDRDNYAFVTLPSANRLAVVALNEEASGATDSDGGMNTRENCSSGCLLGYLEFDSVVTSGLCQGDMGDGTPAVDGGLDASVPEPSGESDHHPFTPFAIVASSNTGQLYVGGLGQQCILELNSQILINEAKSLEVPGPLSLTNVVGIRTAGYTTRAMSLEPELERFIYAITKDGSLFVIDTIKRALVNVHDGGETYDIKGRARTVELFRFNEDAPDLDESKRLFTHYNGTYGVVTTSRGEITLLNVDAADVVKKYEKDGVTKTEVVSYPPHSIRSRNDLALITGDRASLQQKPILYGDDNELSEEEQKRYAFFKDGGTVDPEKEDAGPEKDPTCFEDGFHWKNNYGIRFQCDPRVPKAEQWSLTWEGALGISGAATLLPLFEGKEATDEHTAKDILFDETKNFCEQGAREGDLVVIKNPILAEEDCKEKFPDSELFYIIESVQDYRNDPSIEGSELKIAMSSKKHELPTVRCFRQAVSYEIRAAGQWVLWGTQSGHLRQGTYTDTGDGPQCVPGPLEDEGRTQRVTPGERFSNYYLTFTLLPGEEHPEETTILDPDPDPQDAGTTEEMDTESDEDLVLPPSRYVYRFGVVGGFTPLFSYLGNNITDVALGPDGKLIMVDQAENGLIIFDLLNTFSVVGQTVN